MNKDRYPTGTVRRLIETDLVTEQTRSVLKMRLEKQEIVAPVFFDVKAFQTLRVICMRLIPQPDRTDKIDLAGLLDEQLAKGNGNGWRYNQMPPDEETYLKGLEGINETSMLMFDKTFDHLEEGEQEEILRSVQFKSSKGEVWKQMPSNLFFEELLASLAELYYSHPLAKEEIGDVSFADANGWQKTNLNELEAHEPVIIKTQVNDEK